MSRTTQPALRSRGLSDPSRKGLKYNEDNEKKRDKNNSKDTQGEDARKEKSTVKANKVQNRRLAVDRRLAVGEEEAGKENEQPRSKENEQPGKNGRSLDTHSDEGVDV